MNMNYLTLITILSLFSYTYCLQCYLCIEALNSECATGKESSFIKQTCKTPRENEMDLPEDHKMAKWNAKYEGRKIVTKCVALGYQTNGTSVFTRGCGYIYKGVDICEYVSHLVKVKSCKSCDKDFCNTM